MGSAGTEAAIAMMGVLGLGFFVQGFRGFPWIGVNFYLKDDLGVSPSTLQLLQHSANIPMVGKPIYGLVSDAVYIRGAHRLPYIAIGVILQAISWILVGLLPKSYTTISKFCALLLLGNMGASIAEVANDAIVAEAGKKIQPPGRLQALVWTFNSFGGVFGNLLGGVAVNNFSPKTTFILFALLLFLQLLVTITVPEQSLELPQKKKAPTSGRNSRGRIQGPQQQFMLSTDVSGRVMPQNDSYAPIIASIRVQFYELKSTLQKEDISYSICWFAASYAIVPVLMGNMFYYQTEYLKLDPSVLGLSKVFGQGSVLAWSLAYNKWLKRYSARKLLTGLQGTIALFMFSDFLFVKGFYRHIGVSDSFYVIVFSGLLEALFMFKILPFSILMAQLCPVGCEGSLMAFVMSATALASIISGYFGVALASFVRITKDDDFSSLTLGILIAAAFALLPLNWSSWISNDGRPEKKDQ